MNAVRKIVRGRPVAVRGLLVAVLVTAAAVLAGGGAGAKQSCDRFASPRGLDVNPGTEALPFRTPQKLADSLAAGQTGCLRAGTYGGNLVFTHGGSSGAPITLQSNPGERSVIIGRVWVPAGSNFVTVSDLDLVGLNGGGAAGPLIEANDVTLEDNDITNIHTADCVYIGQPAHRASRVTIRRNRIHNCGRLPATNREHGISVYNAADTEILENVIFDNADRGVQLLPNAQRTHVAYNTIDGNGEGLMIAGANGLSSNDNVVERNLITNSTVRNNVETYWPAGEPAGTGNVIRSNCVFGGARDNGDGGIAKLLDGVVISGNLVANPLYVDRIGKNFRVRPESPCLSAISTSIFRPFTDSSPWNVPAAQKGAIDAGNPFASEFANSSSFSMKMSGTPDNPTYASPVYFAEPGDPTAGVNITIPSWNPDEDLHYDGKPIPVPPGAEPETGSDGHLTIVSANRRTAWEFWGCTVASPATGFVAKVVAKWDLTGPGYSRSPRENSARGSGTPLIATSLRAEEALHGIQHALGITVPSVGGSPIYPPASHTDGGGGGIQYGMLFVLRSNYPVPPDATPAMRNVIQALQTYGAYVIDQGAQFEMDADNTHPEQWAQTGIGEDTFDFTGADFRLVHTPGVP